MTRISRRAQDIAPFYAMEFARRAAELERAGADVVKLSIGEPDFGAPPAVTAALRELADGRPLPYTGALGLPQLRTAIAGFYAERHGCELDPQRVVVTAGASAALLLTCAALVDPGDEVLVADPSYPCNRQFAQAFGARVRLVQTSVRSRYQLETATVRAAWGADTRGVMIATPSNPTGSSVPPDELDRLLSQVRGAGAWRLVDEIYLELADAGADGQRPGTALSVDDGAIVVNSFSKYFGMTGWRLGWCVVPNDLVPVMERLAQNYFICPSTPAQQAALACFEPASIAVCDARRDELARRRTVVLAELEAMGLSVPVPPDGAFYVYVDISATGMSAWEFCERALDEVQVSLTPGRDFGDCTADTHVRLSYSVDDEQLIEGLRRLAVFTRANTVTSADTGRSAGPLQG